MRRMAATSATIPTDRGLERRLPCGGQPSGDLYAIHFPGIANIHQRIGSEHDKIRPLACFERAQVARDAQELRSTPGSGSEHLRRSQSGLCHQLRFPVFRVSGKTGRRAGVRSETVAYTSVGQPLQIALRPFPGTPGNAETRGPPRRFVGTWAISGSRSRPPKRRSQETGHPETARTWHRRTSPLHEQGLAPFARCRVASSGGSTRHPRHGGGRCGQRHPSRRPRAASHPRGRRCAPPLSDRAGALPG